MGGENLARGMASFFMLFFRILPRQRTFFKISLIVVPYPFSYIHRLIVFRVRIWINHFILTVAVFLPKCSYNIIINFFTFGTSKYAPAFFLLKNTSAMIKPLMFFAAFYSAIL